MRTPTLGLACDSLGSPLPPLCHDFSILASLPKAIFFFITWFRFLRERERENLVGPGPLIMEDHRMVTCLGTVPFSSPADGGWDEVVT